MAAVLAGCRRPWLAPLSLYRGSIYGTVGSCQLARVFAGQRVPGQCKLANEWLWLRELMEEPWFKLPVLAHSNSEYRTHKVSIDSKDF